ncbi:imidazole glycerol phosphate synthase subunit HisH [Candidatus Pelagibacter sp.]|nr:imidazole glycerol phosphate synthase subunit HisH [Candidatus Pelagibacter sp.]
MNVVIIDYKSGNTKSVSNLLNLLKVKNSISCKKKDIIDCSHLILPGVGAYEAAMRNLKENLEIDFLSDVVLEKKKPILGICVGMQIMTSVGYEFGEHKGLNWLKGMTKKIETNYPLPHIGWNDVVFSGEEKINSLNGNYYFVNSYSVHLENQSNELAKTEYGKNFLSVFRKENIFGCQFHPEKSQSKGISFMNYFLQNF